MRSRACVRNRTPHFPFSNSIETINSYGLEVTSGIILGLDTDTGRSADRLIEFIVQSQIPILTINLLQALPKTPLWDRLARDQRLMDNPKLESNVRFLRPYDQVLADWRRCIAFAYAPEELFKRFRHQVDVTYVNRFKVPRRGLTPTNLRQGLVLAFRVFTRVGLKSRYRREFWGAAFYALRRGQIEAMLSMGFVAHHLIKFTQEALRGEQNASFYSTRERGDTVQDHGDRDLHTLPPRPAAARRART